jgi:hypothetical protein
VPSLYLRFGAGTSGHRSADEREAALDEAVANVYAPLHEG